MSDELNVPKALAALADAADANRQGVAELAERQHRIVVRFAAIQALVLLVIAGTYFYLTFRAVDASRAACERGNVSRQAGLDFYLSSAALRRSTGDYPKARESAALAHVLYESVTDRTAPAFVVPNYFPADRPSATNDCEAAFPSPVQF